MSDKRNVNLHIHDVVVHGKRVETLKVRVPFPAGLTKKQRRAFADGAADAASHILNTVQPRVRPQKTGFGDG
jgi:hypothetical protein